MTFDDRVKALGTRGFTDRQARFLVTVMLHSGVCMVRQYCAFAGMVYGQTARDFFARLTAHRIATAFDCAHKRARIYHIRNRALYQTIGEPHSRLRKPVTLARAIERVMLLDAVLAAPHLRWLATEGEKVEHFSLTVGSVLRREEFPCLVFGDELDSTVRYFPDRQPIGLDLMARDTCSCISSHGACRSTSGPSSNGMRSSCGRCRLGPLGWSCRRTWQHHGRRSRPRAVRNSRPRCAPPLWTNCVGSSRSSAAWLRPTATCEARIRTATRASVAASARPATVGCIGRGLSMANVLSARFAHQSWPTPSRGRRDGSSASC